MLVKIRVFSLLVVFLLLFQPLDAKKRKQHSTSLASKIENSIVNFMDLIYDAWDGLLYLLPDIEISSTTKKKSKKNQNENILGIDSYVISATNNLNYLYKSVSDSVQMLELESKESRLEPPVEGVFSIELLAAEIFDGITRGVLRVVSGFDSS